MQKDILKQGESYTFSDYSDLNYPTKDVVAEFDYGYRFKKLMLPCKSFDGSVDRLKESYYRRLPHLSLTSDRAKREVLIAPLLLELMDHIGIYIDIEYPINVNERLKGKIDYLVRSKRDLVIVAARKSDIDSGFTQLAIELIALEQHMNSEEPFIYGAVTLGDRWRFGVLDRKERIIYKDIDSFRVPADLEGLFEVMIGILKL